MTAVARLETVKRPKVFSLPSAHQMTRIYTQLLLAGMMNDDIRGQTSVRGKFVSDAVGSLPYTTMYENAVLAGHRSLPKPASIRFAS